jgi:CMP-N-acetylneuraminic acid synthetase
MTTSMTGKLLAVIPARGGSKRVPGKNIRELCGRPILAYTVEAALRSGLFARVIVNTDSEAIADTAARCGADVPFLREATLADDYTPVSAVTVDTLERLDPQGERFEAVCQLMANCPLRDSEDVEGSYRCFEASGAEAQISTSRYGFLNPWWALQQGDDGRLKPLFAEELKARSQDLPELYCPNGAIWWAQSTELRRGRTFHLPGCTGFELCWQHAMDIDTDDDWALAELLMMQAGRGGGGSK